MTTITINADLGESFGLHSFGNDDAVMEHVDLVNVACGAHAGDPEVMRETVEKAVARGLRVGAHPGLPDLVGFGRREMKLLPEEVESLIIYQVGSVVAFLTREGAPLSHIKPHGSLYGMLARDEDLMAAAARAIGVFGVPMLGMAGTAHETGCAAAGIEFIPELYVDLDYRGDGSLIIPRRPKGTEPERAARRVRRALDEGLVQADDATDIEVTFASVCVHSDIPGAGAVAEAVRRVLAASGGAAPTRPRPTARPASRPATMATEPAESAPAAAPAVSTQTVQIVSPLPGTFYRRPAPDQPVFVEEGADVEVGQTVGLVEIMKQFSEIKAEQAGRAIAFQVEDEASVNPGDVIAVVQG